MEAAESKLLGVLELKPNLEERVEAFNLLAQLYAQTARHRDALEYFASALAAGPGAAAPLTEGLAEMFEKQEEWEQAIGVYMQGLTRCEDARLHNGLGYCLDKASRLREAEHHHRRAMELAPDVTAYANDLGYVLLEQGELQQARVHFERALHLDPAYELARNNLSLCSKQASEPR